jgi:hypothetical protein
MGAPPVHALRLVSKHHDLFAELRKGRHSMLQHSKCAMD